MKEKEYIGLDDIDGNPIAEGDVVFGFAQDYEGEELLLDDQDEQELGGLDGMAFGLEDFRVFLKDHSKPLPVADIPLFKGEVVWDTEMLAYHVRMIEVYEDWKEGAPCCVAMGGGAYAYQIVPE